MSSRKVTFEDDEDDDHTKKEDSETKEPTITTKASSNSDESMWETDGWELTWPIWHMLPREEKKNMAHRHGYATIGAFEENMALQRAIDQTEQGGGLASLRIDAGDATVEPKPTALGGKAQVGDGETEQASSPSDGVLATNDTDDDDASSDNDNDDVHLSDNEAETAEQLTGEEAIELAGTIMVLHEELLHLVFSYLPVDMFGTLALVSPHWKYVTRTESVYKRLCERLYLNQSKRKQLHVSRFGNLYRRMLEIRPRVRTAGGCYVLKYARVKKIQRDMWTEIPVGAILETIYYRYMYFQEDGRVLYALSPTPPNLMLPKMLRICLQRLQNDPVAVWGTFHVQKNQLIVMAKQSWTNVKFELTIQQQSGYGKFGTLVLNRHFTSVSGSFDESWRSHDLVEYDVPSELFRFVSSSRL
eukprot:CAMPEP_0119563586 /NCGR_PEP_ID=MMETSP1352-20130426/23921_1 /TAXON_ID=265584 /ORGANISM="Stauroneis constricta, Strain CCMP1120" /LENGTH=415 /DNA_ID=CAMNT_0007612211 /DNA_START=68 /DNA_END=1315 /DNA_ORIENTATION=+